MDTKRNELAPTPACGPAGGDSPVLDPKHPGIDDAEYVARRRSFYHLAREYRVGRKGIPRIDYTPDEDRVWGCIVSRLEPIQRERACATYLRGRRRLAMDTRRMPQLAALDAETRAAAGLALVPAEGMIPSREFFAYLADHRMPCTQYLRHHARPEYTPEPDAVHDVLGHVPLLMNRGYAAIVAALGRGGAAADERGLTAFSRLYWFTVEFGLIEEDGETKILGAGLLSSFGEMEHALSDHVDRRPYSLDDVITTSYDPTRMQRTLYVLPSLDALRHDTERMLGRFGGA
jgi:phenylalanine-4-hydroxylase